MTAAAATARWGSFEQQELYVDPELGAQLFSLRVLNYDEKKTLHLASQIQALLPPEQRGQWGDGSLPLPDDAMELEIGAMQLGDSDAEGLSKPAGLTFTQTALV